MNSVIRKIRNRSANQTLFCRARGERRTGRGEKGWGAGKEKGGGF